MFQKGSKASAQAGHESTSRPHTRASLERSILVSQTKPALNKPPNTGRRPNTESELQILQQLLTNIIAHDTLTSYEVPKSPLSSKSGCQIPDRTKGGASSCTKSAKDHTNKRPSPLAAETRNTNPESDNPDPFWFERNENRIQSGSCFRQKNTLTLHGCRPSSPSSDSQGPVRPLCWPRNRRELDHNDRSCSQITNWHGFWISASLMFAGCNQLSVHLFSQAELPCIPAALPPVVLAPAPPRAQWVRTWTAQTRSERQRLYEKNTGCDLVASIWAVL